MTKTIEKVAAGLRKMDNKPDAFLFMEWYSEDFTWDAPDILGIPVFHTDNFLHNTDDKDCPIQPMWKDEKDYMMDVALFRRGYDEY